MRHPILVNIILFITLIGCANRTQFTDNQTNHTPKCGTVFSIGDSISLGLMWGFERLHHPCIKIEHNWTEGELHNANNAQNTNWAVQHLDEWIRDGLLKTPHLVTYNQGMWDMCIGNTLDYNRPTPVSEFKNNITYILTKLRSHFARVIVIGFSYAPTLSCRYGPLPEFEKALKEVAKELGLPFYRMYDIAQANAQYLNAGANGGDVHFTDAGNDILAREFLLPILEENL